jgi:hypothetical protein
MVWIGLGPVVSPCDHGTEPSGSMKDAEYLD